MLTLIWATSARLIAINEVLVSSLMAIFKMQMSGFDYRPIALKHKHTKLHTCIIIFLLTFGLNSAFLWPYYKMASISSGESGRFDCIVFFAHSCQN